LLPENRQQAFETASLGLEAEPQAELHFAGSQSAGSLAKVGLLEGFVVRPSACGRENEVRVVENVEASGIELHVEPFRYFENLGQGHIGVPLAWTNERVAAQVAYACQASRPGEDRQITLRRW